MSSYRRYYLPRVSWSDVKGGVWRIQPYNVTEYFFIFRVQNLLTSARGAETGRESRKISGETHGVGVGEEKQAEKPTPEANRYVG